MTRHRILGSRAMLCGLFLLLMCCGRTFAQNGTSSVRGTVTDQQGQVIPGATVTLTNIGTNNSRTATTSANGNYVFELIEPGDYRLDVEAKGFKKGQVSDVHALIAKPTPVDVQLEVGNLSETVTVQAGAEVLVNKDDASLGNNFVSKQITQLPLEARNVASLLTLQPGVTRNGYVAGTRSDQANVTLDGVDINEQQTNQIGAPALTDTPTDTATRSITPDRTTVLRLNAEAIEEFRVTTTNANAQSGRTSGAQISLITKSGTNDFHGALFEFHRPTVLTSNDFFNNRAGLPRPALIRNTFGGAIGGPVIKNRAFFFYSFEARRDRSQTSVVRTVPLASLGQGQLRYVNSTGGVTTLSPSDIATIFPGLNGNNPAAVAALAAAAAKYPANDFTTGDSTPNVRLNTAGYRFNAPLPVDLNSHSAKFDLNLTSKQTVFVRTNVIYDLIAGAPQFPDTPALNTWSHPWGIAVGHTWSIHNNLVNNFRYGMTREAFTQAGDLTANDVFFRFVFNPTTETATISRLTPTHNFIDDLSWVKGTHTMQFGTNVRVIRNRRTTFANAYDVAYTNPSYYAQSGSVLSDAVNNFNALGGGQTQVVQNAAAALLGRLTTYTADFTFNKTGDLQPAGTPTKRTFGTEEYDVYGQDVWKMRSNLTVTYGLRYSLSRPVYELNGYETKPSISLSDYLDRRIQAAQQGKNYTETLLVNLSGPANNSSYMYPWDKNNFQPRIALAWSPNFKKGWLAKFFGSNSQSVIRGGFAITNDYIGQQLAVRFDLNNSLGFSSSQTNAVGFCNVTNHPCPSFTGFGQGVRNLPGILNPGKLTFPQQQPADMSLRIESSLDSHIVSPTNYSWNLTFERELPKGMVIQASYLGRLGRNLLASRDVMMPNDLVDPKSGMDWYTAAGMLEDLRRNNVPVDSVQPIPYFENLFGGVSGFATFVAGSRGRGRTATQAVYIDAQRFNHNDWTTTQSDIDFALLDAGLPNLFYQPQYGALASFSTVANSNYHAGTLSVRERFGQSLTMDFNYTLSKSMDDASGLQTATSYNGASFILNPLRQHDNYSVSDFDVRHIVNINGLWQLPIGRGRLLNTSNGVLNAVVGGWQLSGIFRYNSGLPISVPFDAATWATNWNAQSWGTRTRPVQSCPNRGGVNPPSLFGACDLTQVYQSFRNAKPGETGDRNALRLPGYINLDMGVNKSFSMPWSEKQKLELRFEAFNVTNTQRMGFVPQTRTNYGLVVDPQIKTPPPNWSSFTGIQGDRRVMQFGFRFTF